MEWTTQRATDVGQPRFVLLGTKPKSNAGEHLEQWPERWGGTMTCASNPDRRVGDWLDHLLQQAGLADASRARDEDKCRLAMGRLLKGAAKQCKFGASTDKAVL